MAGLICFDITTYATVWSATGSPKRKYSIYLFSHCLTGIRLSCPYGRHLFPEFIEWEIYRTLPIPGGTYCFLEMKPTHIDFRTECVQLFNPKTDIDRNSISPISPEIFGLRPCNNHPPLTVHGFAALKSSRSGGQNAALESASFLDVQSSLGKTYQLMIDGCKSPHKKYGIHRMYVLTHPC